jgi:di/tricarboxylate transporter
MILDLVGGVGRLSLLRTEFMSTKASVAVFLPVLHDVWMDLLFLVPIVAYSCALDAWVW